MVRGTESGVGSLRGIYEEAVLYSCLYWPGTHSGGVMVEGDVKSGRGPFHVH